MEKLMQVTEKPVRARRVYLNDDDTAVYYIFVSLSSVASLFDFGIWISAFGQIVFSLGAGMTIVFTYASYSQEMLI